MAAPPHDVEWAAPAAADLDEIIGWIAEDRPQAAQGVFERLHALGESLAAFPNRGRMVPELKALGLTAYRELISPPWRLVYRTLGSKVTVLLVLDSRRDAEEVLLNRLIRER